MERVLIQRGADLFPVPISWGLFNCWPQRGQGVGQTGECGGRLAKAPAVLVLEQGIVGGYACSSLSYSEPTILSKERNHSDGIYS